MASPALIVPPLSIEEEIVKWTDDLYETQTSDKDREKHLRDAWKIVDYIEGKQWSSRAKYGRSRPVVNKTFRHFWENVGLLTDLALDFQIKLYDKLNDFSEFEAILNQLSTFWAQKNSFEDVMHSIVCYGLINSGPSKLQWNPRLNNGMGDVELIPIAPWNISYIGTAYDPQDAECILYYRPVTLASLVRKFGDTAKRVKPDIDSGSSEGGPETLRPPHMSASTWSRLSDPLKQMMGQKNTATSSDKYPLTMLKEFWLKDDSVNESSTTKWVASARNSQPNSVNWGYYVEPGMPLYPRGRVICQAGGCVLEDACNPYWHAKFPFPIFRPFRVPWKFEGLSPLKPQLQLNNIINRINGGVLDMINAIIEPTLIAPKAAFPPADWDALDPSASGGKIKYQNNSPRPPEFAKRAEIPGWVFNYLDSINKESDMISASSAVQQALGKKQVPGEDALEKIISSRSMPVKVQSRSLTSYIEEVGYMGIADMLQFYSIGHRVAILGAKGITAADYKPIYGEALPQGMEPEEFVRKFAFNVKPGSTLSYEKNDKVAYAFQLRKQGDLSRKGLYRTLDQNFDDARNRDELLAEAKDKLLIAGAAAAVTGKSGGHHK